MTSQILNFNKFLWLSCVVILLVPGTQSGSGKRGPHHPRGCTHKVNGKHEHNSVNHENQKQHDKEHIESHLKKDQALDLTEDDYNFYLFQMHDLDNNNKLDGLEILKMFSHDFMLEEKNNENDNQNSTHDIKNIEIHNNNNETVKINEEINDTEDRTEVQNHEFIETQSSLEMTGNVNNLNDINHEENNFDNNNEFSDDNMNKELNDVNHGENLVNKHPVLNLALEDFAEYVDTILQDFDVDGDGFLDYSEYVNSKSKM